MRNFTLLVLVLLLVGCSQEAEVPEVVEDTLPPEMAEPERPEIGSKVMIPAGEFAMGTDFEPEGFEPAQLWFSPEHTVDVPAYEIDVYEVTAGQWIGFLVDSGYQAEGNWRNFYATGRESYPVTNVTWTDATAYCEHYGGRLPNEAEWEKAARGPEGHRYPWGDEWDPDKSNLFEMGLRNITEAGEIATDKSGYGVYDMMGNVQEWTLEKLAAYPGSPSAREDVFKHERVVLMGVRGGAYAIKGPTIGAWIRFGFPDKYVGAIGFRCVYPVEEEDSEESGS